MPLQTNRPFEVTVPHLGPEKFALMSMEGSESVSQLFRFRLRMVTLDGDIDEEDLLRKPLVVKVRSVENRDEFRHIHGLIQECKLQAVNEEQETQYSWEVTIAPWLYYLTLDSDIRHFENLNAQQIIEKVFQAAGFRDFTFKLQGALRTREFTVQYRESSFHFVSRLMEEEGIFYWFEHSQQKHQLILTNKNSATTVLPGRNKLSYGKGTMSGNSGGIIDSLEEAVHVHTGKVTLRDYNFTMSTVSLEASTKGKQLNEIYDYPGNYTTKAEGENYAKLQLEEQEARLRVVNGHTQCTHLMPGYRFDITDHFRDSCNTTYILLSQNFSMFQDAFTDSGGGEASVSHYFTAIPFRVPYRPPKVHAKPIIHGVQTGIVTGPAGNEIYCDKYGRVKVRFHWDRLSEPDPLRTSCWIRVAQGWAGMKWGQIHIPRIDNEVIVSFIEGDPDRPIITGMVYNSASMPPYALPDNQTQSGIKTHSSPGGSSDDFNEFRFEDKKGSEQIYLHAQKDFDVFVENKHTVTVRDSDQIVNIQNGNQETTISTGNRTVNVTAGNHNTTVNKGNHTTQALAGAIVKEAAQKIELKVAGSVIRITPAMIELSIGASSIKMSPGSIIVQAPMIKLN